MTLCRRHTPFFLSTPSGARVSESEIVVIDIILCKSQDWECNLHAQLILFWSEHSESSGRERLPHFQLALQQGISSVNS